MKRFLSGVLVVVLLAAAAGCSKDDGPTGNNNNNNGNNSGNGSMRASVNGGNWTSIVAQSYVDNQSGEFVLYGTNVNDINTPNSRSIEIILEDFQGTGTYTLSDEENAAYLLDVVENNIEAFSLDTDDNGIGGTVVVTHAANNRVKGTFQFNLEAVIGDEKRVVTSGTFDLPIVADE